MENQPTKLKKFLFPIVLIVIGIVIPFIGMTITPTRDLILGLAPKKAILILADKIDENRIANEEKIKELQIMIDDQNLQIAEQQKIINEQEAELENQKTQTAQTSIEVTKTQTQLAETQQAIKDEAECRGLYAKNTYCNQAGYRSQGGLDQLLDKMKEGEPEAAYQEDKKDVMKRFNKCQEIIAKCG